MTGRKLDEGQLRDLVETLNNNCDETLSMFCRCPGICGCSPYIAKDCLTCRFFDKEGNANEKKVNIEHLKIAVRI